jgi:DNA repair protein RecO
MHHKYHTKALVLSRSLVGEDSASIALLTQDLGLVRARAQGIRKRGARLASSLQTLSVSHVSLIRGKEYWRVTGAILEDNYFEQLPTQARARAGRIVALVLRLVHGESPDAAIYGIMMRFLDALSILPEELHDTAECVTALHILQLLGVDAADTDADDVDLYDPESLQKVSEGRSGLIARINRGIAASGL